MTCMNAYEFAVTHVSEQTVCKHIRTHTIVLCHCSWEMYMLSLETGHVLVMLGMEP